MSQFEYVLLAYFSATLILLITALIVWRRDRKISSLLKRFYQDDA